jgi:hypothetical protein
MTAPARIPLHQEMATASRVAAQLIAFGIDESDPDFVELMASETDVLERLRRILRAARHTEAQSKALGEMQAEMRERKTRLDKKADSLRSVVLQALGELGLKKLEAPDFSASVGAPKPRIVITDEAALPDDVCIFSRTPSKTAIREALAEGPVVGAELSNGEPSLTVRVR